MYYVDGVVSINTILVPLFRPKMSKHSAMRDMDHTQYDKMAVTVL